MDPESTNLNIEQPQDVGIKEKLSQLVRNKKFLAIAGVLLIVVILVAILFFVNRSQTSNSETGNESSSSQEVENNPPVPVVTIHVKQQQADQDYADWERKVKSSYPWMNKFPLRTEKYFIYFDLNKKVFVGLLYPSSGDDPEKMKADIINELKLRGVKTENYKIEWTVNP